MDKAKTFLNIIRENILYVVLTLVLFIVFFSYIIPQCLKGFNNIKKLNTVKAQYQDVKQQYDALKLKQEQQNRNKKVVKDGKIVFEGTPEDMLRQETPYTKQFVTASLEGPMKMIA